MSEKLTSPTTNDNSLSPSTEWDQYLGFWLIFKGSCLKQKIVIFNPPNILLFLFIGYLHSHET